MKAPIYTITNTPQGTIDLPPQFDEPIRPDLIRRAILAIRSNQRQAYGNHPEAGNRASAKLSRRRRDYKGAYGMGVSRVPRKTLSRQGTRMNWVGAQAPGTVKGRQAHPPKTSKQWSRKINARENQKAICSALAASINKDLITSRGHIMPPSFPFILDASAERITKTKDLVKTLHALGFTQELERAAKTKIRPGKATMRTRRIYTPRSILLVVSQPCPLLSACRNMRGVDASIVTNLNAHLLAPGGLPGRITLYTTTAVEQLSTKKLYT